jgi:Rps23 Pro-64 3,4-dihydroxylase Tpa1-like proline 4-hydroxylase
VIRLLASAGFVSHCLVQALSRDVPFPLTHTFSTESEGLLIDAFGDMVGDSDFLCGSACGSRNVCTVPALGEIRVAFKMGKHKKKHAFVLSVDGGTKDDFGWICAKMFECRSNFEGIDTSFLESVVEDHFSPGPNPGCDAAESKGGSAFDATFRDPSILEDLTKNGFVVIDTDLLTSPISNEKLSQYLLKKSGQSADIRSDTVGFLGPLEAKDCGLDEHFSLLMAIASHLNDNIDFRPSEHKPIFPGTVSKPLTNPEFIQAAEYGEGEFYVAHRDTSLDKVENIKSNFRYYTCILYCNDNWTSNNGGALRIYPDSKYVPDVDDAGLYVDVIPQNGRLLIFDSMLVHSVERVIGDEQKRRALTLWIKRPDDSGVKAPRITKGEKTVTFDT